MVAVTVNGTPTLEHFYRWSGSAWTDVGTMNPGNKGTGHATVAIDSGSKVVAAFTESPSVYAQRFNAGTFTTLGAALNPVAAQLQPYGILRADASGDLRLAIQETTGSDVSIYVYKWDGTSSWGFVGKHPVHRRNSVLPARDRHGRRQLGRPLVASVFGGALHVQRLNP